MRLATTVLFLLAISGSAAQAEQFVSEPANALPIPAYISFVASGPTANSRGLRVAFHRASAVYQSVFVEELAYSKDSGVPRVVSTYLLSGFRIAALVGETRLTNLEFHRWLSPMAFELLIPGKRLVVRYISDGAFDVQVHPSPNS